MNTVAATEISRVFAENLRRLMEDRGITHAALAEAIGVATPRISEILRAGHNPRLDTVEKIAIELDVSVAVLLTPTPSHAAKVRATG